MDQGSDVLGVLTRLLIVLQFASVILEGYLGLCVCEGVLSNGSQAKPRFEELALEY
jgi:hypothetical protein